MRRVNIFLLAALSCATLPVYAVNIPGRLFYTPSQRATLDAARNAHRYQTPQARPDESLESEAPLLAPEMRLNGIVQSDGRTQLLINNQVRDARPGEVLKDGSARVANQRGRSVDIKVGQRVNPYTGKVESSGKTAESINPMEQPREPSPR